MRGIPGARLDPVVVKRDASTSDADGNIVGTLSTVYDGHGTFIETSADGRAAASGRPSSGRSGFLRLRSGVAFQAGDRVIVRGVEWQVSAISRPRDRIELHLTTPPQQAV